jgi:hypothetical protein
VLLTSRVLTRNNEQIKRMRPQIHDAVDGIVDISGELIGSRSDRAPRGRSGCRFVQ